MRILLAIAHYFKPEANPKHGSVNERRRETRKRALEFTIQSYRGLYERPAVLNHELKGFAHGAWPQDQVDIAVVSVPGCSLLEEGFAKANGVRRVDVTPENPRMLGFHVHELLHDLRFDYDMFAFSEDDVAPRDPDFFAKIAWFNQRFGDGAVLQPNRYEWSPTGPAIKTHIDGDMRPGITDPLRAFQPGADVLQAEAFGRPVAFRRQPNPHAGFFAVTQSQLLHWVRQPHWLDRDCGLISPLESSATLALVKTFAAYKPFGPSAQFLELQHLDAVFAHLQLPWVGGRPG